MDDDTVVGQVAMKGEAGLTYEHTVTAGDLNAETRELIDRGRRAKGSGTWLDLNWLDAKNRKCIEHLGLEKEKWTIIEEMSELTKAMSKYERGLGPIGDILEEAADVLIMSTSAATSYGFTQQQLLETVHAKIKRLEGYFAEATA